MAFLYSGVEITMQDLEIPDIFADLIQSVKIVEWASTILLYSII